MPTDRDGRGTGARSSGDRGRRASADRAGGAAGDRAQRATLDPRIAAQDPTVAELAGPLAKVLARLPATQRRVLELRMGLADGHPHDLADTARALGLSLSEARDIEARAFEHIREVVPLQQLQRFLGR
jgi:DNA-directed RNA polymerase specialized sigma24 family protein